MKMLKFVFLFTLVLFSADMISAQDFEGYIVFKSTDVQSPGDTSEMRYYVKGSKARLEFIEENGNGILFHPRKVIMLMHDNKQYMEFPVEEEKNSSSFEEKVDIKKTDETREILGYKCQRVIINDESGKIELWVTDSLGSFQLFENPMFSADDNPFSNALKGKMPLLMIEWNSSDEKIHRMEAVEVKDIRIDDFYLNVPRGYKLVAP